MSKKRIKVFLGGYVNFLNAQNINCRALSEHLDKAQFEVWTMLFWYQNAKDFKRVPGVHYLKSLRPSRFFAWLPYLIGILRCDVAFLPKGEYVPFCHFISKISGCKLFTTVEGVLDEELLNRMRNPMQYIHNFKSFEPHLYSITKYIATIEKDNHGLQCDSHILYLGTEADRFLQPTRIHKTFQDVVMIGNDLNRKKGAEFIQMALVFPNLNFHIVGGNDINGQTVNNYINKVKATNIIYHGLLDHTQLSNLLCNMDLMYFPSRSEGFPKVMLETACAGVPTLCYGDYGADEWITTGKDGYVVNTFEEAKDVIQKLIDQPKHLQELSLNAIELGKRFDWKVLVKDWEEEIVCLAQMKK